MRRATLVAVIVSLISFAACSGTKTAKSVPVNASPAQLTTLLTIGGSATEGDGLRDRYSEGWPYRLFHQAFPISTDLVNAAVDGATVANVGTEQVSLAGQVHPEVVAIWLGIDDLAAGTPVATFKAGLLSTIADLRKSGARTILVADLPGAYGAVDEFDTAIRDVVRSTKATLVELRQTTVVLAPDGRFPAEPDAASQQLIASRFAQALKQP